MKQLLLILFASISLVSYGQSSSYERDSVAQTPAFQVKVKMATHKAANNLLADPNQPVRVRQYAQLIVSSPMGAEWLAALSYGCMTNVAINWNSPDDAIEFTVNSLFSKYSYAYYRELPPSPEDVSIRVGYENSNSFVIGEIPFATPLWQNLSKKLNKSIAK